MQGKILIVDDIATNRIVFKVKLASAFYEVFQAASLEQAFDLAQRVDPDVVICAMALPDGTAADFCRRLQGDPQMIAVPVLAISAAQDTAARLEALDAGVQDVMQKPVDDSLLLARVRSLIRARNSAAEWQLRDDTSRALGFAEAPTDFGPQGRLVMVSKDVVESAKWATQARARLHCAITCSTPDTALRDLSPDAAPDVFVLVLSDKEKLSGDVLRLLAAIRATATTRHAGILVLQPHADVGLGAYALDLGADDLMADGFEVRELALRVKALLRRKRIADQLRATVRTGLKAAVSDPLTGLHNRRYAMPHLARVAERSAATGRTFAVMVADLDHFKRINDLYGHAAGDAVLVETAQRLRDNLRAVDLVARIGGEEFLIVMPATPLLEARAAASRLCRKIGGRDFSVPGAAKPITVTISIGLTIGGIGAEDLQDAKSQSRDPEELLQFADEALYNAKVHGRNRVNLSRPAA